MINGWYPKINASGQILSGNAGIWLTENGNSKQISSIGTSPFWLNNNTICYNRNDGTTVIGNGLVPQAYNEYYSSEFDQWTGFVADANLPQKSYVDFYQGIVKTNNAPGICLAKYSGDNLCYVAPYNNEQRTLIYNNNPIFQGKVTNYVLSSPSGLIAWQIATSTYGRQILNQSQIISIRNDENPILGFDFLGQTYLVTQCAVGQLVYPIGSHFGYLREGDLYYPDGRVFGNNLRLVGSTSQGIPLFDNYIDLLSPRIDLRLV